ncbi:prepilin-type N-terminal cleavage/methylation domain-containing protein [Psychrobacillus sp. FJAT-51614]|uniref:Prepilin-type N-terminal cleavage/methylation domain-containing protein n=1 Tax=Psychrobacillus mangrovi TaxID=3117745 RepID=A0ABU8F319_9BACI
MASKQNQNGLTLVELLAAIVIFSVISLILWRFFFQTIEFSDDAMSKNQLQKEANIILNTIQQMHTQSDLKSIKINNDSTSLTLESNLDTVVFNNPGIIYQTSQYTFNENPVSFKFEILLSSSKNPSITYKTNTTFRKLTAK